MSTLKSITLTDGLVFRLGGMDRPRGWPEEKGPQDGETDLVWQTTETGDIAVTFLTPTEGEGEPTERTVTITAAEVAALEAATPPVDPAPLTDRLKTYLDSQPAAVRAMFEPLRRPVWDALERGDHEVAKILIENAEVPAELEDQRQAMLAEFPQS